MRLFPESANSHIDPETMWFVANRTVVIKTASPDAIAAMKQFSEALLCSTCAPDGDIKVKGSVQ